MREEQQRETVRPARDRDAEPRILGPDPRQIGAKALYARGVGRPINCR